MKRFLTSTDLPVIFRRMRHEDLKTFSKVLFDIFNENVSLMLTARDFSDIRFIQGYLSAVTELIGLLPQQGGGYGKEKESQEEKKEES